MGQISYLNSLVILTIIHDFSLCVIINERMLRKKEKQMRDWFDLSKCHMANIGRKEERFFSKTCNGLITKDGLSPKATGKDQVWRREYRCLSKREKKDFHEAVQKMKITMAGDFSEYDNFVIRHDFENAPAAHYGPAFLGWHRHFLLAMEQAIRKYCPNCGLPYWDNRLERRLDTNHRDTILFSEYLLGNNDGLVLNGLPGNWTVAGQACRSLNPQVVRHVEWSNSYLFADHDVETVLVNSLKDLSAPWNSYFEDIHGSVHMYFGASSSMGPVNCSPNDPVFFLHHCFIDSLFEKFRQRVKGQGKELVYPDTKPSSLPTWFDDRFDLSSTHAGNSSMKPFANITNSDGLTSEDYTTLYYRYEKSPGDVVECKKDRDCCASVKPEFIWCNNVTGKCVSKVREKGNVEPAYPDRACYCPPPMVPTNDAGVCKCSKN